jgi:tetratricopeptide (TPR) repeat protein
MLGIAVTLASVGKNSESETILRKAFQTSKTALGEANSRSTEILNGLGMTLFNQGKHEEALVVYTITSGLLEQAQGKENPDFLSTCNDIGLVQYVLGNLAESYDALQKALDGRRAIYVKRV